MNAPRGQDGPQSAGRRLKGRAASRMMAVQALYEIALSGAATEMVVRNFAEDGVIETGDEAGPITLGPVDRAFFGSLVEGVGGESEGLDDMLSAVLVEGWPVERLELVLKLILRAGAYELGYLPTVPARVAVSQYVDLAHAFLDDKQAAMANGVLDRLAHSLRPDEFDGRPGPLAPDDFQKMAKTRRPEMPGPAEPPGSKSDGPGGGARGGPRGGPLGEFELIRRYLVALAADCPGALGLRDDAAILTPPAGRDLVLCADALVEGVHFLSEDPADLVARKLLRCNLSDLAAMGAAPLGYLMTAAWPRDRAESWIAAFAAGLAQDQEIFQIALLGGDTTATPGPLSLSLTALGSVPAGRRLERAGARAGDRLYLSGTLGDAALGLRVLRGDLDDLEAGHKTRLAAHYRLPEPRLALGQALLNEGLATAAIDVSDGLVADVGHIAETSGLAARIEAAAAPLSAAGQAALTRRPDLRATVLTGGDDYELAFTAAPGMEERLADLATRLALPLTHIGEMAPGEGVAVLDAEGHPVALDTGGWTHF